jgi:hypothetical protein
MFTTRLEVANIKATGAVEFDEMNNAIVSIEVAGELLTETEISAKEFEVLSRYFAEVKK